MFRNLLVSLVLTLFAMVSFAASTNIDVSGLTEAQVAELKAHAASVVAQAAKVPETKDVGTLVTLASTWGTQAAQAAEGFAKAFSIAAKELGITVNEFLQTDAGKLTAALIVWKVAGAAFVKILYAALFVSIGQTVAIIIYRRLFTAGYESVQYENFWGAFKGTKKVRIPKGFSQLKEDGEWLAFWVMLAASIGSLVIGALIIS